MRRWGGCNLPVIIRISYNNGIWRVWTNGETHSKVRNRVTPEFKEMLNKYQLVNKKKLKIKKKKKDKQWCGVDIA